MNTIFKLLMAAFLAFFGFVLAGVIGAVVLGVGFLVLWQGE